MSNKNDTVSSNCKKSAFTITFVIELLDTVDKDVSIDYNKEEIELGTTSQNIKLQYQLYFGKYYELEVLIWPQVAKILCGAQSGWVRTWQFLERRWIAFSISHAFPVRVNDLLLNTSTVFISSAASNLKADTNNKIHLPPLKFGQTRYFAPVIEGQETIQSFMQDLFWIPVKLNIPEHFLDGPFDCPHTVKDIRHQETSIFQVRELILNNSVKLPVDNPDQITKFERDQVTKDKITKGDTKYGLKLSGNELLAGVGRVILFNNIGDRPKELGGTIVLISSKGLPASDDLPVFFVNIDNLFETPVEELVKCRINHIYTRWKLGNEIHQSQHIEIGKNVNFQDHYPVPLPINEGSKWLSQYISNKFEIQLRCLRDTKKKDYPNLFGQDYKDSNFSKGISTIEDVKTDVLFAICKVEIKSLLENNCGFIRGEFPIYPINNTEEVRSRELFCTNDINNIQIEIMKEIVPTAIILEAQMSLQVSIGLVGCRLPKMKLEFLRLYCIIEDEELAKKILKSINNLNEELLKKKACNELLTGWMVDVGDSVLLYLEGPSDKRLVSVCDVIKNYQRKAVYITSKGLESRLYYDLLKTSEPFLVLKMFVPLNMLLVCPPFYTKPALPSPTKDILMKLDRLLSSRLGSVPCNGEMPTVTELRSLRLELCSSEQPVIPNTSTG